MKTGRLIGMLVVSSFALAVMAATGLRWTRPPEPPRDESPLAGLADSPAAVATSPLTAGEQEVILSYSGMIQPYRRYSLSLEEAGLLMALGEWGPVPGAEPTSVQGAGLDEGDRVRAGEVLAQLDRQTLEARKREAAARIDQTEALLTQAEAERDRAERLRERSTTALSEEEWLQRVTAVEQRRAELDVAQAQLQMVETSLQNSTLRAPVDGVISRRFVNPGEVLNPRQPIFELVEVDRLRLVLGVPESRIRPIAERFRHVRGTRAVPSAPAAEVFRAHVQLLDADLLGRRNPRLEAEVFRLSETADDRTGLFEVEVLLDNREGALRPGMVARADLVVDRVEGYRIPLTAALFRNDRARLFFAVDGIARMVELDRWIEQGSDLLVPLRERSAEGILPPYATAGEGPPIPPGYQLLVVAGQHRLVDGRPLEIVRGNDDSAGAVFVSEARP